MSLLVVHVVGLAASAVALLLVALTRFATDSLVERIFSGIGAVIAGVYAYHLAFRYEGGRFMFFGWALILPLYAGFKLYVGFRRRHQDRAERQAARSAQQAADEWRATRRW
ncbi:hypothetical protein [Plantactinospora sp. B5E13]|uniref:hypothetical protein n=1 Tax=unclassified Plantactinospora TaxID=2631981 RepID=UPI00325CD49B